MFCLKFELTTIFSRMLLNYWLKNKLTKHILIGWNQDGTRERVMLVSRCSTTYAITWHLKIFTLQKM